MKDRKPIHDNWKTPEDLYKKLDDEFFFDFDPCPLNHNVEEWSGLNVSWGNRNFVNPPYSRKLKEDFVKKGIEEMKNGKLCVFLIPVSTSTVLFHDFILPNITEPIRFLKGRVKFEGIRANGAMSTGSGQHDSMVIVFDGRPT